MDPITTWKFSLSGHGNVGVYRSEYRYAGGAAGIGFGDRSDSFEIYSLGQSRIALKTTLQSSSDRKNYPQYWNSHFRTENSRKNSGMLIWVSSQGSGKTTYDSNKLGPEQTFVLENLGWGNVAFKATAGAYPGQYLSAIQGGWWPQQWGFGSGSFLAVETAIPFYVDGDHLPILIVTNSGYRLNLPHRNLGALSLANANMSFCNLTEADLSRVSSWDKANFTGVSLMKAVLPKLSLAGANWNQTNFTGADLTVTAGASGAFMLGAILDQANLQGMNLSGAALSGASFQYAVLDHANLSGADLSNANFAFASMTEVDLRGANLHGTHFDNVDLSSVQFGDTPNFSRTANPRTTFVNSKVPFAALGSNWSWLDLTGAAILQLPGKIEQLVADGALLPNGLNLERMDLSGASFVGTRMYEIQLQGANLEKALLKNALLKGAKLNNANLTLANLDSAYLISEQASHLLESDADREAAVAAEAIMFNTILDGAHCDGVDFSGALFVTASELSSTQTASAIGASMNFAKFADGSVVLAVFNGAQLSAADFSRATMIGASFRDNGTTATQLTPSSDSVHTPASVYRADISGADFTGANMDGLDMENATFTTTGGNFEKIYEGYGGKRVPVAFKYGPTVLGNTTTGTTCPDGEHGPCKL